MMFQLLTKFFRCKGDCSTHQVSVTTQILSTGNKIVCKQVTVCAMAKFLLRSNVKSTGLSTGTTKSSPPRLSLRSRLGDLLSGPSERAALSASRSRMRLYGHLVCARGPTLLTNPEPCKLVEEHIFYALQVRTWTI